MVEEKLLLSPSIGLVSGLIPRTYMLNCLGVNSDILLSPCIYKIPQVRIVERRGGHSDISVSQ